MLYEVITNIRSLPLKTLLVYLELNNVIESKYSYYASYRFKFIDDAKTIIDRFQGERRSFVETIFQCSPQAKIWCSVDFDALWLTYSADRSRVIAAVDYFHEKGWIELESKQTIDRITSYNVCYTKLLRSMSTVKSSI